MRKLIASMALIASMSVHADTAVYLGGWSHHFRDHGETNETHNLVMVEYENFLVGTMENSYDHRSVILGYGVDLRETDYVDIRLVAGAMSGYQDTPASQWKGITPLFGFTFEANTPYVKPVLLVTPYLGLVTFKVEF